MDKEKILIALGKLFSEEYPKYYKSKLDFSGACEAVKVKPSDEIKKIENI